MKRLKALSLFSNVGISECYLKENGIDVVVANELEKDRADFYRLLYPDVDMVQGDITKNNIYEEIKHKVNEFDIDLIIATPPCQGMSIAHAKRADKNDPRNSLIKRVVTLTKYIKPKYVLVENVPGMLKTNLIFRKKEILVTDYLKRSLGSNYNIEYKPLDCADYGTPQHRSRLITLMSREGKWLHPEASTPKDKQITVKKAIGDLPSLESGEKCDSIPWHSGKNAHDWHIHWMKHTPTGKSAFNNLVWAPCTIDKDLGMPRLIKGFRTTYKRIDWNKPAPAITMQNGSINSQNNVHPGREKDDGTYSDARVLSVREILILCGLPDNWLDKHQDMNENFVRKVLGECFPPKFCLAIMKTIPEFQKKT